MDFFILRNVQERRTGSISGFFRKIFRKILKMDIVPLPYSEEMFTIEQQINFHHLINYVIKIKVEGEFVELGSFTGSTAIQFQKFIQETKSLKKLYLFDNFSRKYGMDCDIEKQLVVNFEINQLNLPEIVRGVFETTLPDSLPNKIAFAHIDCGYGGDIEMHKRVLLHYLDAVYSRMSKNGICIMMDYYDSEKTIQGLDSNPGVKLACDEFFKNKPEHMIVLYGGYYSHAYFEKK